MRAFLLLSFFFVWMPWQLYFVSAVSNDCSKNFQYIRENGRIFGKLTLFHLPVEQINVTLVLSQKRDDYPVLTFTEGPYKTSENLIEGKPISYRLTLTSQSNLPHLIQISVNGNQICSNTERDGYNTIFWLIDSWTPINIQGNGLNTSQRPAGINFISGQSPMECGRGITVKNRATPLIIGGEEVPRGKFPWLVAIFRKIDGKRKMICDGSLVSSRSVLTAGHCFKTHSLTANQILTCVGCHNLDNYREDGVVMRRVSQILIHPDYNKDKMPDADLAILRLSEHVSFTDYIKPICLWSEWDDVSLNENLIFVIAGWGSVGDRYEFSTLPNEVETGIVSDAKCLRSSSIYEDLWTDRTFCGGKRDGTGPCKGDSGGGLMIQRNGRWTIRGILSAGEKRVVYGGYTCDLNEYMIYCDLAKHLEWIENNLSY